VADIYIVLMITESVNYCRAGKRWGNLVFTAAPEKVGQFTASPWA